MKKFKKILVVFVSVLTVFVLASCQETKKPTVEFLKPIISLSQGEEINLEDESIFKIENAKIKDVLFVSSNHKVAIVSPDNKIKTVEKGTATITAKVGESESSVVVSVSAIRQPFAKVSEIVYNPVTSEVSWNPPFLLVDGKEIVANPNDYKVEIKRNGLNYTDYEKISNTKYKLLHGGNYYIGVSAIASSYDYSEESSISFTVLDAPTGFKFEKGNNNTHIVKWDVHPDATIYELKVNDETKETNQTSYSLNLEAPNTYFISLKAIKSENEHSVYTEPIKVMKFQKPVLKLENGILKVDLINQEQLDYFKLTVKAYLDEENFTTFKSTTGEFNLSSLTAGNYVASVVTVAKNTGFLISSEESDTLFFEKLDTPTISFDAQTNQVSVSGAEEGVKLFVEDILTKTVEIVDFVNGKYDFDKPYGEFRLWAQNLATENNVINSDVSSDIIVKVLAYTRDVQHSITMIENAEKSVISFQKVLGATNYEIKVDGLTHPATVLKEIDSRISFVLQGNPDKIFEQAKEYEVEVIAIDSEYSNILIYGQVANNKTVVTRLDAVEEINFDNSVTTVPITWKAPNGAIGYTYVLERYAQVLKEGILESASFEVESLDFGSYKLQIYTTGNQKEFLSSLNYAELEFAKHKKLTTPILSFDRESKMLLIGQVENANAYMVFYEDELKTTLTDELVYDISDLLIEEKEHNFSVIAVNSEDNFETGGNLIPSEKSYLNIVKLESVKKVVFENESVFKYDEDLLLSEQDSRDYTLQVKIDGQVVDINALDTSLLENFDLSVIKIANTISTNPYFISSEEFLIEFERLEKVKNLSFVNWVLEWDAVENADGYKVVFESENFNHTLTVEENILDLNELDFKHQLESGFSFSVQAIKNQTYLENGQKGILSGSLSEPQIVGVLEVPQIESVEKIEENKYRVVWSEIENAKYLIDFENDKQTIDLNEKEFVLSNEKKTHTLKLKAVSPNYISSEEYMFVFERLAQVEKVNVFEDSTFEIVYNMPAHLKAQTLVLVNNESVLLENKIDITSVGISQKNQYEFEMQVVAEFIFENAYYISSEISEFAFEKHLSIENLKVEDGSIKWQKNPNAINYELVFKNNQEETLSLIIPARDTQDIYVSTFSLSDYRIKEFVESSSFSYVVAIKVKINDYELEKNDVGKIDGDLSESVQLSKLPQVQNLDVDVLNSEDEEQKVLELSWDAVQDASFYNVYVNNNLLLENQTATRVESEFFTFENSIKENNMPTGRFEVYVIAFANNQIESEPSQVLNFVRLKKVEGFKTTSDIGGLQWNASDLSENFVFYMENQINETSDIVEIQNAVTYNYSDILKLEMFKEGKISLYILMSGNGKTMFSSAYQKIDVVRLDAPNFEIEGDKIVVQQSVIYENASFELTVYFKEAGQEELVEIEKFDLSAGEFTLLSQWKYKDGSEIAKDGVFVFEMVTVNVGYITSVDTVKEKVKLNNVIIEGIKKVENAVLDGETSYQFIINIGNVAQTDLEENPDLEIVITVTNSKDNNVYTHIDKTAKNRQGQVVYDNQEIFLAMKGNFNVRVKVTAVGYIDSKIISIGGARLEQNQSLVAKSGVLTWTRSIASSATGYMLKVDYGKTEEGNGGNILIKKVENLSVVSDALEGISGALTANVKVLSNMQMNIITNKNIVLDSFYMGQVEVIEQDALTFEEEPYLATKLPALEEVQIKQGMFYFKKLGGQYSVSYSLIPLQDYFNGAKVEYDLSIEFQDEHYIQALSNMFYQGQYKLLKNNEYVFSIKAFAQSPNILNSDAGQELRVKVLSAVENINVQWKEYETGETNRFDTVTITWNQSLEISSPKYIYSLGNESSSSEQLKIVDNPEYIIRSNNALNAKNYNFRVRVMGSSEPTAEGFYYLTSEYASPVTLTGLATPNVYLSRGVVTWDAVPFAEGYNIYYMKKNSNEIITPNKFSQNKTWFPEFVTSTSWVVPDSFSDTYDIQAYYIAVVAINRDISRKYMPSGYGTMYKPIEENEEVVLDAFGYFVVAKSPELFQNNDGVLMWYGLDYEYTITFNPLGVEIKQGINPFVYGASIDSVLSTYVTIKIGDDPSKQILMKDFVATSLFYANIFDNPLFKGIAPDYGFNLDMRYGIGHIDKFINETFPQIKAGNNFISVMQIGNNANLISSKYNAGKEFYVPQQVNTKISNSVLSWKDIVLPIDKPYANETEKYIVISEDDTGKRFEVTRTNELSIDLLEFINNDILKPGDHKLYVIVAGDGADYLNGIASPPISIFVLPPVNARLDEGILTWDSMQNASGFRIQALTSGEDDSRILQKPMNVNKWEFEELKATNSLGESIAYNLIVQATGNGVTIISGKETNFGTIIKLSTPNVDIVEGVFKWANVQNNVGYRIDINGEDIASFTIGTGITQYESVYEGFNTYNFRAVGSTTANLQQGSLNYAISSYMPQALNAVMLKSVENTSTQDGQIIWKGMTDYSSKSIEVYKMTFSQENFKPYIFLDNNDYTIPPSVGGVRYIAYQLAEDYPPGVYRIYMQAYSNDTYIKNSLTYRYLLSAVDTEQSSTQFEKLQEVENTRIVDGVVHWDNPNQYSPLYHITLIQGTQSYVFVTQENHIDFTKLSPSEMENYEKISADSPLSIKVKAIGNQVNVISSDEVRVNSVSKLKTLTDIGYVSEEDGTAGFIIRWYLTEKETDINDYHYIISYIDNIETQEVKTLSSANSSLIVKGYDQERKLNYAEIDAAYLLDKDSSQLSYRIAVAPITNSFFISSNFSAVRSVSPPESLNGEFVFDQEAQKISWAYSRIGSDVIFKIVDELIEKNADNEIVVIKTNTYLSQEKEFFPREIGLHRIKIAVVLGVEGQVSSGYVYFYHETTLPGLINDESFSVEVIEETHKFTLIDFNLFESGEGSSELPYKVSTETHFKNIKHRVLKPTYLSGENKFTFIQTQDLVIQGLTTGIQGFANIYDGQEYTLTYHLVSSKNTALQDIALFESITSLGHIKNLIINANLTINQSQNATEIKMSALSRTNSGIIENVLIKSFEVLSNITNNIKYIYGVVTIQNQSSGIIKNTISKANITFKGGVHEKISNSDVTIGGIVENNAGQIVDSGNYANFEVVARRVTIAGIAVVSQENASLTRVFNKGNITATMQIGSSSSSYIAGLVGRNIGLIYSSYSSASKIEVDLRQTAQAEVYIGGLVGLIQGVKGSLISNSYTLTTEITVENKSSSNINLALMVGESNAQDNQAQIMSYYEEKAGIEVINGTITTFKRSKITNMSSLLVALNQIDSNAFKLSNGKISHIWEDSFTLS